MQPQQRQQSHQEEKWQLHHHHHHHPQWPITLLPILQMQTNYILSSPISCACKMYAAAVVENLPGRQMAWVAFERDPAQGEHT